MIEKGRVPLCEGEQAWHTQQISIHQTHRHLVKNRVLLVEGDSELSRLIAEGLTRQGFDCIVVDGGNQALDALRAANRPVDIVLMDLRISGPSGCDLIRRIRANTPGCYITMMTDRASAEEVRAGYRAGAKNLLRKPISLPRLIRSLEMEMGVARKMHAKAEARQREGARPWYKRGFRWMWSYFRAAANGDTGKHQRLVGLGVSIALAIFVMTLFARIASFQSNIADWEARIASTFGIQEVPRDSSDR